MSGAEKPNRVRQIRQKLMLSKAELARKAKVTVQTIDRIESGKDCRTDTKRKIILALGYQLSDRSRVFIDEDRPQPGKIRHLHPPAKLGTGKEKATPVRVLLVDDSESNRVLFHAILSESPCHLDTAKNGKEGLEKFVAGKYDLVLMDIQMPVMDGYTATSRIRQWEQEQGQKAALIIAVTANAGKNDREKCLQAGCDDYMTKPVPQEKLLDIVDHLAEARAHSVQ